MATGRINRKVLDHIAQINKENKAMNLTKELKKEVETGKHGLIWEQLIHFINALPS